MTPITHRELEKLMTHNESESVSVFMPTHKTSEADAQQDPIRFKNLIRRCEQQMLQDGMRSCDAHERLMPLTDLVDDSDFWQHRQEGLVVFLDSKGLQRFTLPYAPPELAVVGDYFHLKPLFPLIAAGGKFYVLAMSLKSVRLFRATERTIQAIALEGAPVNYDEIMEVFEPQRQLQMHAGSAPTGPSGRRRSVFGGVSDATDEALEKRWVLDYCHRMDDAVCHALAGQRVPLVLAMAQPVMGLYRQANSYADLSELSLRGNYDRIEPQEIHRQVVALLAPMFEQGRVDAISRYRGLETTGRASHVLEKIVPASLDGQVDTLLVSLGDHLWGRYDPDTRRTTVHSTRQKGDRDLLDLVAVQTYLNSGTVYTCSREMLPPNTPMAAMFRFAA